VPSARHGRVAVMEPVFSMSPPWTMERRASLRARPCSGHAGSNGLESLNGT